MNYIKMDDESKKAIEEAFARAVDEMSRVTISTKENDWYSLPYEIRIGTVFGAAPNVMEIDAWCEQMFGPRHDKDTNPNGVWAREHKGIFNFKNESDRTAFILKWS